MLTRREVIVGGALAASTASLEEANAAAATTGMVAAAAAFVAVLDDDEKKKAMLPFNSDERLNWHYVPMERKGLHYKSMTPAQQEKAHALLLVGLSSAGYKKIEAIRQLENVLHELENGNPIRDPGLYYFTIFGEPSEQGSWGWRYEGHHVSLHWTILHPL